MKNAIIYATTDVLYNILMSAVTESQQKKGKTVFYTIANDYRELGKLVTHDHNDIYGEFYTVSIKKQHDCTKIILEQAEEALLSIKAYNNRQICLAIQTLVSYIHKPFFSIIKGKY